MNRNNKIFQIVFSILILGIAFLLLLCIGICSPKTVVRPAVVDAGGRDAPPPDILERTLPTYTSSIDYTGYTLSPAKNPTLPRQPDDYNEQLQSYIYYSRANEREIDAFQLLASLGLFILNILTVTCSVVYILKSLPDEKNP